MILFIYIGKERNSYLLREFEEITSAAEEQRILNFKIHKEALEKAKNLEGEVEYLRSEIQRLLSEQQSRDSERQREELERQKQRDEEIARNLKIEEERERKRQFDEALALAIKDETEKHLRVAMAIREEVEQRLQTFKESGSVRDERLRLLELSQASIPTLLSAELKALDDKIVQKMSADLSSLSESLQTTVIRNCNLAVAALREQVIKKFEHFDERDRQREAWQLSTALVSEIVNDAYEAAEKSIIAAKRQSLIGMETSQKILQEPSSSAWPSPFISRESSRPSSHHKDAEGDGLPTDDVISTPVASEAKTPQPSRPNSAPLVAPLPDVVDIEAVEAARAFEQAKAAEAETARIVEQLNDEIAQHAQEAKKAKQEVRRFVQQFITKNNRKPSKGERKMFAKDIFKTYHAVSFNFITLANIYTIIL